MHSKTIGSIKTITLFLVSKSRRETYTLLDSFRQTAPLFSALKSVKEKERREISWSSFFTSLSLSLSLSFSFSFLFSFLKRMVLFLLYSYLNIYIWIKSKQRLFQMFSVTEIEKPTSTFKDKNVFSHIFVK